MSALTGTAPATFYGDLLRFANANAGATAALQAIEDGLGVATALQVSTAAVASGGQLQLTTVAGDLQWLASGTPVAEWSVYDDGAAKWLAAGDGGGDATGDGRVAASYYMVGPVASGGIIKDDGSGNFLFRTHADGAYANVTCANVVGSGYATFSYVISNLYTGGAANNTLRLQHRDFTVAGNAVEIAEGTASNTTGKFTAVSIKPIINQASGDGEWVGLEMPITTTAVGTGGGRFLSFLDDTVLKFAVSAAGALGCFGVAPPSSQPALIADPSGGATVDAEARTAINAILDVLAGCGLMAAS
jgi:hypothetical protein